MPEKHFSISQVAVMCGITREAVHQSRRKGKFPHAKKVADFAGALKWRLTRGDVREYMFQQHNIDLKEVENE